MWREDDGGGDWDGLWLGEARAHRLARSSVSRSSTEDIFKEENWSSEIHGLCPAQLLQTQTRAGVREARTSGMHGIKREDQCLVMARSRAPCAGVGAGAAGSGGRTSNWTCKNFVPRTRRRFEFKFKFSEPARATTSQSA